MKYLLLVFSFIISVAFAYPQFMNKKDSNIPFGVGYENIVITDSGRFYKPNAGPTDRLKYRPIEIDAWYPASASKSNSFIQYGELIKLLELRSNRFQEDTIYNGLASDSVQYICANLKIADTAKLIHLKTNSCRNAEAIQQKFPLIVYMCSFNGMSYENINLFERLSSHGYVVACITSVGRYPGNMSMNPADLMEQVQDGLAAINFLKKENNIDTTRIGIVGYRWGSWLH